MGISILRASISEDFSFRASLFSVLSDVSTGPSFILKWVCICLRAIDTAADPQKDGRDDAKEHLIEGAHKRAPTTGLHTYRNIRESSFKCLLTREEIS